MTDHSQPEVLRYAAFTADPRGGNPAGVVLDAGGMTPEQMQTTAAAIGYSETAFLVPRDGAIDVRYFSPLAEVSFCGHATVASAVAYAERHGPGTLTFATQVGPVEVLTEQSPGGAWQATLTSVQPRTADLPPADLARVLSALRWSPDDLDPALPPRTAYAAGGVVEDPATGAAAAALGGSLRDGGHVDPPATVVVHQGDDVGRPSRLVVDVPAAPGSGIRVTGAAVRRPAGP
jgi:predicted PhzF superfamily epimerase YddE/YHI9